MKFKVGDKVRVTNVIHTLKNSYVGSEVIIKSINPNGNSCSYGTHYGVEHSCFIFTEKELAPIDNRKIVITIDGKETLARIFDGDKVIKSAVAKCSPEDDFCFETGAKLAFDRLIGEDKPKYYNGKVICVDSKYPNNLTRGKIYRVVDGVLTYDSGKKSPLIKSFEDLLETISRNFIELVE